MDFKYWADFKDQTKGMFVLFSTHTCNHRKVTLDNISLQLKKNSIIVLRV